MINTEVEAYPVLAIWDAPLSDRAYEIPRSLWDALCEAQTALVAAKASIMRYVSERHPDARSVQEWVRDYDEAEGS